jgi:eukaryotic-like serine/threonine-protein kinase
VETAVADPLTGAVLDRRYRVGTLIARGGMSAVYEGVDLRLDRPVAIKVMAPGLARDPTFAERFTREARAAARLSHPNVVAVFDQGVDGEHVFLVMELVRGRTLRDLLAERGRLAPEAATSLLEPMLGALAAAHRAGLVHRDVKPENVLLSDDGAVKVADFGLARAVAGVSATTQAGVVFGTVAYVSPEQVAYGRADPRSDVYAAGIVLYELLTGSPPYRGDAAIAVAYRHVHDDVPPPSRVVPSIPRALDGLVRRATSRNPDARPADAGVFLAELSEVCANLGLPRVPVPPREGWARAGRPPQGLPQALAVRRRTVPTTPSGLAVISGGPGGRRATTALPAALPAAIPPRGPARRPGRGHRVPAPAPPSYPAPAPPSYPAPPPYDEQRGHRRRLVGGLVLVLLLGVMAATAGWWYGSGRFVEVPPLAGLTQRQALDQASAAHLRVRFGPAAYSDDAPAGTVARTDPGAGDRVRREATIVVVMSRGPAPVLVPEVVGRSRDDAQRALAAAGLRSRVTEEFSTDVPSGAVIRQSPRGTAVPRGSTVTLVVSRGPDLVEVPRVVNMRLADAVRTVTDRGFTVQTHGFLGGLLKRVFRQSPGGGQQAPRGATVTLDYV